MAITARVLASRHETLDSTCPLPLPYLAVRNAHRGPPLALVFSLGASLVLASCDRLGFGDEKSSAQKRAQQQREAEKKASLLAYVGRGKCTPCHEDTLQGYAWSAHDRSLDLPERDKVAAPFLGETVNSKNASTAFTSKDGRFVIHADKERPVVWTIGYAPIQRYLVQEARGRVQVSPAAFDSRVKSEGGQRWFLITPSAEKDGADAHFSGDSSIWNSDCARCHSTRAQKNYRFESDSYETKFSEIDVSCEACHGPASRHVELAEKYATQETWPASISHAGFEMALATYTLRRWVRGPDDKVARLEGDGDAPPERTDELMSCAPCHSLCEDLGPVKDPGPDAFDDRYLLKLISSDFYFDSGQIKGDAHSYGSFLQSKKYAAGVVCSDCHDPHAATLRQPVVELCASCHDPSAYQSKAHTMHASGTEITCADCHMPKRVFSGINAQHDHAFSSPRPDLTLSQGTPSACDACHPHRPKWAALSIEKAFGKKRSNSFASAFFAADRGKPEAPEMLAEVLADTSYSALVRASALMRWAELGRPTPVLEEAIQKGSKDNSALIRQAAAKACSELPPEKQMQTLETLATDSTRTVRVLAALCSLEAPRPEKLPSWLEKALTEAKATRTYNADSAGSLLQLAAIERHLGKMPAAEAYYRAASERFPGDPRVFIEWGKALAGTSKGEEASQVFERGLKLHPDDPFLMHTHGMSLIRQGKVKEALPFLQGGFERAPRTSRQRFGYAYAVAVHDTGDWAEALAILRILNREYPEAEQITQAIEIYEKKRSKK